MNWLNYIIPDWLRVLHQKLLGRTDERLLLTKPDIWRVKPHVFLVYSLVLVNLVFLLFSLLVPAPDAFKFGMRLSATDIVLSALALFFLLVWGMFSTKIPISGMGPGTKVNTLLLSGFCIFSVALNASVFSSWNNIKYALVLPDDQFENDYAVLNAFGYFKQQWYHDYMFSDRYQTFVDSDYFKNIYQYLEDKQLWTNISRAKEMTEGVEEFMKPEESAIYSEWETFAAVNEYFVKMADVSGQGKLFFQPVNEKITKLLLANVNWNNYYDLTMALVKYPEPPEDNDFRLGAVGVTEEIAAYEYLKTLEFDGKKPKYFLSSRFRQDAIPPLQYTFHFLDSLPEHDLKQLAYHVFLKKMEILYSEEIRTDIFGKELTRLGAFKENRLKEVVNRYLPSIKEKVPYQINRKNGGFIGISDFVYSEDLYRIFSKIRSAKNYAATSNGTSLFKLVVWGLVLALFLPGILIMATYNKAPKLLIYLFVSFFVAGVVLALSLALGGWEFLRASLIDNIRVTAIFGGVYFIGWMILRGWIKSGVRKKSKAYVANSIFPGLQIFGLMAFLCFFPELESGEILTQSLISFTGLVSIVILTNILAGLFAHDYIRFYNLPEK